MKPIVLLLSGLLFLAACNQGKAPKGVIENEKMVAVLTDVHLVDAYISMIPYDDSVLKQQSSKYYDAIYKKYKTSRSDFDKSVKYYSRQPKVLDSMYSQVLTNLSKKEKEQSMLLKKEQNKLLKKKKEQDKLLQKDKKPKKFLKKENDLPK
jgi:hypothetical protein